jgi:hypothetical protein
MSGIHILARGAATTLCAFAAFGPLVGVAAAQEDTDIPPDSTTTSTVAEEPAPPAPPPTVPQQPPPTVPQQPPPTAPPTTNPPTTNPPTTNPPPGPTPTNPPPGPTTPPPPPGTTPTTARPVTRAPVIVFPTKDDGAVSSSTSAPGALATSEPKSAVKTVAGGDATTTTEQARVASRTQERGTNTGDLAASASSFQDSSSSLLPSSTLGAVLLVALVGFLAAGGYCTWLLVFARR